MTGVTFKDYWALTDSEQWERSREAAQAAADVLGGELDSRDEEGELVWAGEQNDTAFTLVIDVDFGTVDLHVARPSPVRLQFVRVREPNVTGEVGSGDRVTSDEFEVDEASEARILEQRARVQPDLDLVAHTADLLARAQAALSSRDEFSVRVATLVDELDVASLTLGPDGIDFDLAGCLLDLDLGAMVTRAIAAAAELTAALAD